ncbi:MAG: response regulator [Gorillibacterium sp.]|nr:response regulator [Gorillibacterium sp.]
MYSILIVDDEYLDLEGMQRFVPWESWGIRIEAAVNSAFEAIEVLKSRTIDILLTDISMPILSGLEMAQQALVLQPELKIIFISGHKDFNYAQRAISLDACGYVLKPVEPGQLEEVIQKTIVQLEERRRRRDQEERLSFTLPVVREELLHRFLQEQLEWEEVFPLSEESVGQTDEFLYVAVIEIDDVIWKLSRQPEEESKAILDKLESLILQELTRSGIRYYCRTELHQFACILQTSAELEGLGRLPSTVASAESLSVTIGLGNPVSLVNELPRSFEQAKEALNQKMFYGKSKLIRFSDSRQDIAQSAKDLEGILQTMFIALTKYDLVRIDDCIEELYCSAGKLGDKLSVYPFTLHIQTRLERFLETLNEDLFSLMQWEWKNVNVMFQMETLDDIKTWLRRMMFQISELLHLKRNSKNVKLIDGVEQYVKEHIEADVSVISLAKVFAFSPNYLRHLFKKETNENLSDYILRMKIERACELLRDHTLKIYEIADRLHYSTITLFNRQFRDALGMSPSDYRKQC